MTKQATSLKTAERAEHAEAANSPYDEETAPLPVLEIRGRYVDAEGILRGLGHQLEQLLALGRTINANLERLADTQANDAGKVPAKASKRPRKKK